MRLSLNLVGTFFLLLLGAATVPLLGAQSQQEQYQQQQTTDESGIFDFNADLYLNYSDTLSDIGTAVSTWSDYAAVSATHMVENEGTYDPYGLVFLFQRNPSPVSLTDTWRDTGLTFQSRVHEDKYGACVALGAEVLVVGAPQDSQQSNHNGAAYVHFGSSFQATVRLLPDEGEDYSYFGASVAVTHGDSNGAASSSLAGGVVAVGAYGHYSDADKPDSGTTVVGEYTWSFAWRLQPSDLTAYSQFGKSVSVADNVLAVGAPGIDKVFVFLLQHRESREQRQRERQEAAEREYERQFRESEEEGRHLRRSLQEHHEQNKEHDHDHDHDAEKEEERDKDKENDKWKELQQELQVSWEYYEVLVVTSYVVSDEELYDGFQPSAEQLIDFGCSVSVSNYTGAVVSIAIGASNAIGNVGEYEVHGGGAYVISMVPQRDVYSEYHINHRRRSLQENHNNHDEHHDEHHDEQHDEHNEEDPEDMLSTTQRWNVYSDRYNADEEGNLWILEHSMFGTLLDERFGSTVSLSGGMVAVGGAGVSYTGRVQIYSREMSSSSSSDYFFKDIILKGPLYNTEWKLISTIYDADGDEENTFGSALELAGEDTILIGSGLMNYGVGSAYLYSTRSINFADVESVAEDNGNPEVDTGATETDSSGSKGGEGDSEDGSPDGVDSASDDKSTETESSDNALLTDSGENSGDVSSFSVMQPYFLPALGALLLCAIVVRIRYCFIKKKKKNKNKKVSSLSDIDFSTNSTSPMMDTSVDLSVSSVQMASTARGYAQQQQISPQPSSFRSQGVPANVYGGTPYAGGGRSHSQMKQPSKPQSQLRTQQQHVKYHKASSNSLPR